MYNAGNYVFASEGRWTSVRRRLQDYFRGVTIARHMINRLKPSLLGLLKGTVIDIGYCDDELKKHYSKGSYLVLDVNAGPGVDLVANAESMPEIDSDSLGGVFCISVLEHTPQPRKVVDEIFRCLKPGGYALISSPWLFEAHMEPHDFLRFSAHICSAWFSQFEIVSVDFTNSHFGLIAHFMQHRRSLRWGFGWAFCLLDCFARPNSKWATQLSYILRKPTSTNASV